MKTENDILKRAVNALSQLTGLNVTDRRAAQKENLSDYELEISAPANGIEEPVTYAAEIKRRFGNAQIGDVAMQAKRTLKKYVLVSEYVTQPQAEKLRELDINFFDTAGNAFLNAPGLYVITIGNKPQIVKEKPISIFRPAGIKLLLAFINKPRFENMDYRTIAAETGVTRTTVGRFFNDLEKGGYLVKRGSQERFLKNKTELIKRWVFYYTEQFRPKLNPIRFHSTKLDGRWWENINIAEYKAVWGGESGGAALTKYLKPQNATVYADSALPNFQAKYGLVRDEKGEIEILKRFWKFGEEGNVAPPLVVYADLLATADERNLETAQMIYDEYLAPLTEENS